MNDITNDSTIQQLEKEVSAIEQAQEAASEPQEETQEQNTTNAIYEALQELGGPSKAQVEQMKTQLGDVYVISMDEENIYVYRPLKRAEWIQLQGLFARAGENFTEDKRREAIVEKCLIWPKLAPGEMMVSKAGFVDTMNEAIMLASYFLPTNVIAAIVEKL